MSIMGVTRFARNLVVDFLSKIVMTSIEPFVCRGDLPFRPLSSHGSLAAPGIIYRKGPEF